MAPSHKDQRLGIFPEATGARFLGVRHTAVAVIAVTTAVFTIALMIAPSATADEIRLKDGKKLYGSIVGYEDNMFRVKTDFGFVLVEKDKIASIIPSTPAAAAAPAGASTPSLPSTRLQPAPKREPPAAISEAPASEPESVVSSAAKPVKPTIGEDPGGVRPVAKREKSAVSGAAGPAPKLSSSAPTPVKVAAAAPPPPKEPAPPANREDVQGNFYVNYTHGFRLYKAPSWNLIEGARKALPNAIVAMGTSEESTLMVVGKEKGSGPLDATAAAVEKRLRDVYENYRSTSQRKTVVSGLPAVEYRFHGLADDHDWSGTLMVVARGADIFSVLGMTYGSSDLIQIQENVIARAIASLDFSAR
ncbi:MAG: hypothetical protein NVS9B4_09570 [Candidatus Acidiferrum sp.]